MEARGADGTRSDPDLIPVSAESDPNRNRTNPERTGIEFISLCGSQKSRRVMCVSSSHSAMPCVLRRIGECSRGCVRSQPLVRHLLVLIAGEAHGCICECGAEKSPHQHPNAFSSMWRTIRIDPRKHGRRPVGLGPERLPTQRDRGWDGGGGEAHEQQQQGSCAQMGRRWECDPILKDRCRHGADGRRMGSDLCAIDHRPCHAVST